jgi:ubiquinone/menaquinone biosynthesis C-methylase UbiE
MTGTTPLEYARWRETRLGAVTERLERAAVLDLAGPLPGRDVLDVGCGDGAYALATRPMRSTFRAARSSRG